MSDPQASITSILQDWKFGNNAQQDEQLFTALYGEMRQIAHSAMSQENAGHTLSATALVHEVFLKLAKHKDCSWENRRHFFDMVAKVMRRTLIDHARAKKRIKRGGGRKREHNAVLLELSGFADDPDTVLDVHEALKSLGKQSKELAQIVELKFFCSMTLEQIADLIDMPPITVRRRWAYARSWLIDWIGTR